MSPGTPRAGHTRVSARAMKRVVEASAAEAFGIPSADVHATIDDADGDLGISLAVPLQLPSLPEAARNPQAVRAGGGTVYERAAAARDRIIQRTSEVAGASVGRVDIRITGTRKAPEARVR